MTNAVSNESHNENRDDCRSMERALRPRRSVWRTVAKWVARAAAFWLLMQAVGFMSYGFVMRFGYAPQLIHTDFGQLVRWVFLFTAVAFPILVIWLFERGWGKHRERRRCVLKARQRKQQARNSKR